MSKTAHYCQNCGKPSPATSTAAWKRESKLDIEYRLQPRNCKSCGCRNHTVVLGEEDFEYLVAMAKMQQRRTAK